MIYDSIKNYKTYTKLNENFSKAFDFLSNSNLETLEPGKYEIDGTNVYASVIEYDSKHLASAKYEAHKIYADIQCVIKGKEQMGFCPLEESFDIQEYNSDKDVYFMNANGQYLEAEPGKMFIFFPEDAHQPSVSIDEKPEKVKKIVVKVKVK